MDEVPAPELSVIVPTFNRKALLAETLRCLERQAAGLPIEIVVADDASTDGTAETLELLSRREPTITRFVRSSTTGGPAAARNRAIAVARGRAYLFLGDDIRPRDGLLERHLEFHRLQNDTSAAMLGRTVPAPPLDSSPFIRWLHEQGKQFAYDSLSEGPVPSRHFYTSNASVKADLIRSVGGFDERFGASHDDVELALRMEASGMRLHYDPQALAEHDHPTDLTHTLTRMRAAGQSYRLLVSLAPTEATPRRPGMRHRAKAAALAIPSHMGFRPRWLRSATWHFLCEEAHREAFWRQEPPEGQQLRIGNALARSALKDPLASPTRVRS